MRYRPRTGLIFQYDIYRETLPPTPCEPEGGAMRYQLRPCADHGGQFSPEERMTAQADPGADSEAGAAGLWWLWGLVESHTRQAEPDNAA